MPRKELDNYVKAWYRKRDIVDEITLANRVAARRERLEQEIKASERIATAKVSRGNVYLLVGKCATEQDLQQRLNHHLSH